MKLKISFDVAMSVWCLLIAACSERQNETSLEHNPALPPAAGVTSQPGSLKPKTVKRLIRYERMMDDATRKGESVRLFVLPKEESTADIDRNIVREIKNTRTLPDGVVVSIDSSVMRTNSSSQMGHECDSYNLSQSFEVPCANGKERLILRGTRSFSSGRIRTPQKECASIEAVFYEEALRAQEAAEKELSNDPLLEKIALLHAEKTPLDSYFVTEDIAVEAGATGKRMEKLQPSPDTKNVKSAWILPATVGDKITVRVALLTERIEITSFGITREPEPGGFSGATVTLGDLEAVVDEHGIALFSDVRIGSPEAIAVRFPVSSKQSDTIPHYLLIRKKNASEKIAVGEEKLLERASFDDLASFILHGIERSYDSDFNGFRKKTGILETLALSDGAALDGISEKNYPHIAKMRRQIDPTSKVSFFLELRGCDDVSTHDEIRRRLTNMDADAIVSELVSRCDKASAADDKPISLAKPCPLRQGGTIRACREPGHVFNLLNLSFHYDTSVDRKLLKRIMDYWKTALPGEIRPARMEQSKGPSAFCEVELNPSPKSVSELIAALHLASKLFNDASLVHYRDVLYDKFKAEFEAAATQAFDPDRPTQQPVLEKGAMDLFDFGGLLSLEGLIAFGQVSAYIGNAEGLLIARKACGAYLNGVSAQAFEHFQNADLSIHAAMYAVLKGKSPMFDLPK